MLEYRFERWTRTGAQLTEFAGGRETRAFIAPFGERRAAVVATIAGDLVITPAGEGGEEAVARLTPQGQ